MLTPATVHGAHTQVQTAPSSVEAAVQVQAARDAGTQSAGPATHEAAVQAVDEKAVAQQQQQQGRPRDHPATFVSGVRVSATSVATSAAAGYSQDGFYEEEMGGLSSSSVLESADLEGKTITICLWLELSSETV